MHDAAATARAACSLLCKHAHLEQQHCPRLASSCYNFRCHNSTLSYPHVSSTLWFLPTPQVLGTDGAVYTLSDSYLPTKALQSLMGNGTPFVAVPEPDSPSWEFLSNLGVTVHADVPAYLKKLLQLSAADEAVNTGE